jgi:hypothetical protein
MPVRKHKDNKGSFYQWGSHGAKYYYIPGNAKSRNAAKAKATRQGIAISANR